MGDFGTVNAKVGTEGGDSTQEKARGQDPLCLHVHILLVDTSEIPQLQPEYPSLLSTHVLCLALVSAMCPHVASNCYMHGHLVSPSSLGCK